METYEGVADSCAWLVTVWLVDVKAASFVLEGGEEAKVDMASSLLVELVLLDHVVSSVHVVRIPEDTPVPGAAGPLVHTDHGAGAV